MVIDFETRDGAVSFAVRVQPRASRSGIVGAHDGALKVRLAAPPVDGAANEELVRVLARCFGVARRQVEILSGVAGRQKVVRISGLTAEACRRALSEYESGSKSSIDAPPDRVVG